LHQIRTPLNRNISCTHRLAEIIQVLSEGTREGKRLTFSSFDLGFFDRYEKFLVSKDDFHGKKRDFMSIKVKKRVIVPFTGFIAHALPILEKYNYTFPSMSNQKFNLYLKKNGEIAKLITPVRIIRFTGTKEVQIRQPKFEFMSSHMARRTFVTIMLEKGDEIVASDKALPFTHTVIESGETLFPEKLAKAKDILSRCEFMERHGK